MTSGAPLYNSRIFQTYLDFLSTSHPEIDVQKVLSHSGITAAEVADSAHWFTQTQADRFYEIVVEKTGDPEVARKAGRYSASSSGLAMIIQYVLGLSTTETALMGMAKIIPFLTRGAIVEARRLAPGRVEITSTPKPDVAEKPYQCENRLGYFEALPKLFTNLYGRIEHPSCYHKGDPVCRYVVTWDKTPSLRIKMMRNYSLLLTPFLALLLYFFLPTGSYLGALALLVAVNGAFWFWYARLKIRELEKIIESRSLAAEARIEAAYTNYNNALLVQEIGRATAAILNTNDLMQKLADVMAHRLEFDRGLIMLANASGSRLVYAAGYGYSEQERCCLQKAHFQLDKPESKGFFVRTFLDRKHLVVTNAGEMADALSDRSRKLIQVFRVRSLLCIPIIYKDKPLGILAVDNVTSKTPLKQSDIHLLEGIASQIAISINNARSFQALQESEARYRQTIESIDEGFFEIDPDKHIRFANKAFSQLVHTPLDELTGSPFDHCFAPGSTIRLDRLFQQMLETGVPVRFAQLKLTENEDKMRTVDFSAFLIRDQNGRAAGFRGFLRDATDRLQWERERKALENRLLHAQKMESIGTLAGGIAHNFNNWLAGILGNITLIRLEAGLQDKVLERAMKIEQIINNAAKMNRQLLSYARGGNYEVKPTNLNTLVRDSADLLGATRRDISVVLKLDPTLGTVRVDKNQIEQVFWNLIVNAMDAMPAGGFLSIRTYNATLEQLKSRPFEVAPGNHVVVDFTDSGTGIDPEHLEIIFEPFFTTKKGKGTGLGLASCYGIIKAHKGFIVVKSQKGKGSTFQVFLPSYEESPEMKTQIEAPAQKGQGRILLVDDEQMVLDTSSQMLAGLGYSVLTAASGEEALRCYMEQCSVIDLVIIDMIMPGMSGGEFYSRVKKVNPEAKTLLCSGYSMNETAREIMKRGCNGFLQKPFTLSKLSEAIISILDNGRPAA